ncbi:MAG: hypothetical protein A2W01_06485 [Candidatus Solincola sediminis]|uniref:Uncharacterized protein n=1 Tax=Candidatus Solincola sediminis TaxID=1797199 RepID=A0A1F2WNS8_9ACTN|nr:MAG: hypothetical protein A2Y75_02805 [Candidatus Solincola sediminis]OFW59552.1 MAG: hypothetical protein A2W01_06485 [Candidatus Solincola sediminis]
MLPNLTCKFSDMPSLTSIIHMGLSILPGHASLFSFGQRAWRLYCYPVIPTNIPASYEGRMPGEGE